EHRSGLVGELVHLFAHGIAMTAGPRIPASIIQRLASERGLHRFERGNRRLLRNPRTHLRQRRAYFWFGPVPLPRRKFFEDQIGAFFALDLLAMASPERSPLRRRLARFALGDIDEHVGIFALQPITQLLALFAGHLDHQLTALMYAR